MITNIKGTTTTKNIIEIVLMINVKDTTTTNIEIILMITDIKGTITTTL